MRLSKLLLLAFVVVGLAITTLTDAQSETGAYRRGDSNQDGEQDITDGIEILSHVILGIPATVPCDKCFDVDDSGVKDINDGIALLRFVILGEAGIPEPFRHCGYDLTPDDLTCFFYRPCRCGTIAGIPCRPGEICDPDPGSCDISDAAGYCVPEPSGGCPEIFDPVCGCDGVTYDNDCFRIAAGAQKDHSGPCRPSTRDGIAGIPCAPGQFCDHPPGSCDISDAAGTCVDVPGACLAIFDPVCGCDGKTYGNDCTRIQAGVQKAYDGECRSSDVCGGIAGIPCDEGEFCEFPAGQCQFADQQGTCVEIPVGCPDVWDPVCGCDGNTYSNDCDRRAAGVQKDHDGPCISICDGIAGFPCDEGEFCDHPPGSCNIADAAGQCVTVPQGCPEIYDPVCGCDGNTYSNDCERIRAGVQKDHDGECRPSDVCGGIQGIPCDEGEFCEFPAGQCQFSDQQGTCVEIPVACPDVWDPVCGCDGVTYSNDCDRRAAKVQKDHDGICVSICDGIAGFPCDEGEFCDHSPGSCNIADAAGTCVPVSAVCPAIFDPVCGCDGRTYGNDCERIRAGVQKNHDGECGQPNICDGFAGFECDEGEFCDHLPGLCDGVDVGGQCVPIPLGCPRIYDPVCGCDGQTYSNDCERIRAGVQKDHDGPCVTICDGFAGFECDEGEFCDHLPGLCDGVDVGGQCVPIPLGCPRIYDPVCGCDGQTYSNDCERIRAGVQKDHDGECGDQVCGGIAGIRCDLGEVCELPPGQCQTADLQGVCLPRPEVCLAIFDPVCGCDGVTYGNDCERLRAGVQKDHDGICGQQGGCGGFAGVPCQQGEFCDLPEGQCNSADLQGTCVPRGEICPAVWLPVCGCNGVTYGNDCERIRAGIQKDHDGVCE